MKKALEDDNNEEEIDEISDDFDDCSIEVIDQDGVYVKKHQCFKST